MTEQRNVSIEAVALREQNLRKRAESDALILQDELITATKHIERLREEVERLTSEIEKLTEPKQDGN